MAPITPHNRITGRTRGVGSIFQTTREAVAGMSPELRPSAYRTVLAPSPRRPAPPIGADAIQDVLAAACRIIAEARYPVLDVVRAALGDAYRQGYVAGQAKRGCDAGR